MAFPRSTEVRRMAWITIRESEFTGIFFAWKDEKFRLQERVSYFLGFAGLQLFLINAKFFLSSYHQELCKCASQQEGSICENYASDYPEYEYSDVNECCEDKLYVNVEIFETSEAAFICGENMYLQQFILVAAAALNAAVLSVVLLSPLVKYILKRNEKGCSITAHIIILIQITLGVATSLYPKEIVNTLNFIGWDYDHPKQYWLLVGICLLLSFFIFSPILTFVRLFLVTWCCPSYQHIFGARGIIENDDGVLEKGELGDLESHPNYTRMSGRLAEF